MLKDLDKDPSVNDDGRNYYFLVGSGPYVLNVVGYDYRQELIHDAETNNWDITCIPLSGIQRRFDGSTYIDATVDYSHKFAGKGEGFAYAINKLYNRYNVVGIYKIRKMAGGSKYHGIKYQ